MAQSFPEKAHLRTDLKKLHENWDAIDWTIKKKELHFLNDSDLDKAIDKDAEENEAQIVNE